MATTAPQEKANGLATYLSVLFSPTAAFAQLARTPMWGWAAIIGIAIALVSSFLSYPEILKIAHIGQAQALAQMSADQQAQARPGMAAAEGFTGGLIRFGAIIGVWIIWLITAVVFVIGAAVTGGTPKFSASWVAAVNASAIAFVAQLVNAIILSLRGPDSISGPIDAYALPSLGMLYHGGIKLQAFLSAFNLGNLWFMFVAAIALEQVLKMKRGAATGTAVVYLLVLAAFAAIFAR